MIHLQQLSRSYRMKRETIRALDTVNLAIESGEFVSILGVSGSGKSTLLHLIGGLDRPTSGQVIVEGQDLGKLSDRELAKYRNRQVGFVFQQFNLMPTLTALENVALPLKLARVSPGERSKRALSALKAVGLKDRIAHRPSELSGGEQQRVAIARAIVNEPRIVLADEPTGNLDTATGHGIVELLSDLNAHQGVSIVVATHDPNIAEHARQRVRLSDGRIVADQREDA